MRAIDADAMKTIKSIQSADFNSIEMIRKWIDKQPTIEPERKKGRWVNEQMDYGECSECGFYGMTTDFCPNCGAEMTEGES